MNYKIKCKSGIYFANTIEQALIIKAKIQSDHPEGIRVSIKKM